MKACVLNENKNMVYQDIPTPKIKAGEVLIKVKACGICSSDFSRVYNNGAYFYPIILGHEFCGEIVECASDIDKKYIGKKVTGFPLLPCNECEFCKQKLYAQCKNYSYFGSRQNGAMAEYIAVPYWNVKFLPDDMDYKAGALCEPAAVAVHALKKTGNIKNKEICISGTGTIGIICGLIAKNKGAKVSFVVRNELKKEFLQRLGFVLFTDEKSENKFDFVFECVGSNVSIKNCLNLVKSHGTIILIGNPANDKIEFSKKEYWKILRSELSILGVWNSSYKNDANDDWDNAITFLYKNQSTILKLITGVFKLEDSISAFEYMQDKSRINIKGVYVNEK